MVHIRFKVAGTCFSFIVSDFHVCLIMSMIRIVFIQGTVKVQGVVEFCSHMTGSPHFSSTLEYYFEKHHEHG